MYNPLDDTWEDGVPLTSGRSGLASAVIYQPSCSQNYSQESVTLQHASREYDESRDQQNPSGSNSSMRYRHPNFHSRGFSSDNNQDNHASYYNEEEAIACEALKKLKPSDEKEILVKAKNGSDSSRMCPIQKFGRRIKHFMHSSKSKPCKLKSILNH